MRIITVAFLFLAVTVAAQNTRPSSTNDLVMECMKTNGEGASKQMSIWYPYNFWQIIGDQMKSSPEFTRHIVTEMKDYMMFSVVDYTIGSSGLTFKTDVEIRQSLKLIDSSNTVLTPLRDDEISAEAKTLLQNLQPIMAQILGQLGAGMRIYLFKAKKVNGQPSVNVSTKNAFTLSWDTTRLTWKTPFASMLAPKFCPVDKEQMKGTWNYCPMHGVKLD